ncbi:Cna B-type domain-containing protein [Lachnoclostridium sp. An131]|uniref:Cna B-type domain-containing protein n=1 Tax=Lachnoclostridium sp. An131 TaxID=1965555 RepID=UPI000B389A0B|nr:Cna B-type domain-containing protein [Lachnoclostridium sp. An131]
MKIRKTKKENRIRRIVAFLLCMTMVLGLGMQDVIEQVYAEEPVVAEEGVSPQNTEEGNEEQGQQEQPGSSSEPTSPTGGNEGQNSTPSSETEEEGNTPGAPETPNGPENQGGTESQDGQQAQNGQNGGDSSGTNSGDGSPENQNPSGPAGENGSQDDGNKNDGNKEDSSLPGGEDASQNQDPSQTEDADKTEETEDTEQDVSLDEEDEEELTGEEDEELLTEEKEAEPVSLEGEAEGIRVLLSGPASSFPEGGELTLSVEPVSEETKEIVDQAVEEQAEKEEKEVVSYTALDIRIFQDGSEIQPLGPVEVKFEKANAEAEAAEDETAGDSSEAETTEDGTAAEAGTTAEAATLSEAEETAEDGGETVISEETKVFHVDEETGASTDMEAQVAGDGQIAIETDHFSIYVVVDLDQLGGKIKVNVEHYAINLKQLNPTGSTPQGGNEGLQNTGGINWVPQYTVQPDEKRIYTDDTIELDNGLKTPVENLSKICMSNVGKSNVNYKLKKIRITDSEDTKEYEASSSEEVMLTGDSTIRMIYEPESSGDSVTLQTPVQFYDYDVSTGTLFRGNNYLGDYVEGYDTDHRGINSRGNFGGGADGQNNQLKFGFRSNGFFHSSSSDTNLHLQNPTTYLNEVNTNASGQKTGFVVRTGIVQNNLDANGNLQFTSGIYAPNLFGEGSGRDVGVTPYSDYKLGFIQEGDTYTLSQVYKGSSSVLSDLQHIREITKNDDGNGIYANNFWPLDTEDATDPKFGGEAEANHYGVAEDRFTFGAPIGYSDDKTAHNWYFGMKYEFTFTLGDYVGPLNFYFRGDDDFWLYVDGVKKIDLGGLHSSVGQYLDLEYLREDPADKEHTITIYYMERGGYGSSCYMQFTLPNVEPVNFDTTVEKTSVTVNKVWEDHNNPNRPSSVSVTLQYKKSDDIAYTDYATVNLSAGNNWSYTWPNLPKTGYDYRVVEKDVPNKYQVSYTNGDGIGGVLQSDGGGFTGTITNKANPSTWIDVTKKWDDGGASEYRPDKVQFQLYYKENGQWQIYPGGLLELTAANGWKGTYNNLPVYVGTTTEEMVYSVREVSNNADLKPGDKLLGKNNAQYIVSYPADYYANDQWKDYEAVADKATLELTVTNTYGQKIQVTKDWKGTADPELTVYAGLYKGGVSTGRYVALNKSNSFTDVFEHLTPASDYSVKELKPADGGNGEFNVTVGDGTTAPYVGVEEGEHTRIGEYEYIVDYGELIKDSSDASLSSITITNQAQWQLIKCSNSTSTTDTPPTLKGAEFELKHNTDKTIYKGVSYANGIVKWTKNGADFTGIFADGSYTLTETVAPIGYALGDPVTFEMKDGVPVKMNDKNAVIKDGILTFYYGNTALYELPSAGGTGIYRYTIGGILLMMAGALVLYKRKRRGVL